MITPIPPLLLVPVDTYSNASVNSAVVPLDDSSDNYSDDLDVGLFLLGMVEVWGRVEVFVVGVVEMKRRILEEDLEVFELLLELELELAVEVEVDLTFLVVDQKVSEA